MKTRVLTAAVLIPIALLAVGCADPFPIAILTVILCIIGFHESANLFGRHSLVAIIAISTVAALTQKPLDPLNRCLVAGAIWLVAVWIIWVRHRTPEGRLKSAGWGTFWVALPFVALVLLHQSGNVYPWNFKTPILLALVPIWIGDTMGILVGMAFGKHKMAPSISPNKTWEGAVGNLLGCVAGGWAVGVWVGTTPSVGILCGLACGTFGQMGDLFESSIKRAAGLKDSGTLLPGHGGVLDRIDSTLFAAIPVALIVFGLS
ncbi:MAG TPA: phosphatidate cytidylyltransferase [Fimbriimonadaceae bacterium]|nr:phosphatidate cytidylyltransferase [Fimbriimonadaceae bacterium]